GDAAPGKTPIAQLTGGHLLIRCKQRGFERSARACFAGAARGPRSGLTAMDADAWGPEKAGARWRLSEDPPRSRATRRTGVPKEERARSPRRFASARVLPAGDPRSFV